MNKATYITNSMNEANYLLRNGWQLDTFDVKTSVGSVSEWGWHIEQMQRLLREAQLVVKTFVLYLENAERHKTNYGSCDGCEKCHNTGWITKL